MLWGQNWGACVHRKQLVAQGSWKCHTSCIIWGCWTLFAGIIVYSMSGIIVVSDLGCFFLEILGCGHVSTEGLRSISESRCHLGGRSGWSDPEVSATLCCRSSAGSGTLPLGRTRSPPRKLVAPSGRWAGFCRLAGLASGIGEPCAPPSPFSGDGGVKFQSKVPAHGWIWGHPSKAGPHASKSWKHSSIGHGASLPPWKKPFTKDIIITNHELCHKIKLV